MRVSRSSRPLELVLQPEIAARLGVSRQRVHQLSTEPGFPEPLGRLGRSWVWDWASVERWATASGRIVAARGAGDTRPASTRAGQ